MAPIAVESVADALPTVVKSLKLDDAKPQPLRTTGTLDQFEHFDVTPVIGREYANVDLVELLNAPNSDELIRDLAVTISERGVVFFRKQDNLTNELQKKLILRLGELTGRPATSGLHIHPLLNSEREILGGDDLEISTISSVQQNKYYKSTHKDKASPKKQTRAQWHSDIAFEPVPADYTSLRLTQLPTTGGDTLWASGYELYDLLSEPYQKFLESLDATFEQPHFAAAAERNGFKLYERPAARREHWPHPQGRSPRDSHQPRHRLEEHLPRRRAPSSKNHDTQVRLKWLHPNDIAIWDNRSVFHTATFDYDGQGDRFGNRAVGLGEKPYLDPNSKSRREDLEARAASS
ncbi:unnamed protein product [Parascedosporium putredinis]|uniref:TauD/TfdA-like domain-containing protein n=1 Tax=Parascedosporium putredinis TaxID=1442378 RepID=A0A9P1GXV9_9PEZI|nr:unnamed protein product [Parascedosporium putredinis]CAI7990172.1 unnamed protein product [Parascedosporium putredinis]